MNDWLSGIERDYEIDILFACEAGSRAWGLESEQSDFDIRFIYRYQDLKKYLSLTKVQTVLDFQSPFDMSGFDLFKAFELIAKSNPSIYEWAFSPVIYKEQNQFSAKLRKVIAENYSPFSLCKHYASLCRRNLAEIRKGRYSFKKQKQLLQAVRAELLRAEIMKLNSIRSPFELIENAQKENSNLFSAYLSVSEAKKTNILLTPAAVHDLIGWLELAMAETEDKDALTKTQPPLDRLDSWIWEIFGI